MSKPKKTWRPPPWTDEDEVFSLVEFTMYGPVEDMPDDYPANPAFARALRILEREKAASRELGVDMQLIPRPPLSMEMLLILRPPLILPTNHKQKRKGGRPKMTESQRRARNPIHDAADMVPVVEAILHHYYPRQRDAKDRAYSFAERIVGMDDPDSGGTRVRNYLSASKKDRRRIIR